MSYLTKTNGKFDELSHKALLDLPNGDYVISPKEERRTKDQNDALWRWDSLLGEFAGNTPDEMHYLMCGEINGWVEYDTFRVPKKTTKHLSKKQWQDYIINYRIKARELFKYEMPNFGWDDFLEGT